jgi:hypothetical protein
MVLPGNQALLGFQCGYARAGRSKTLNGTIV